MFAADRPSPRVLSIVAVVAVAVACVGPRVQAVDVVGDQEAERYVGSGAVVLPGSVERETREYASTCVGCRWKVTAPCLTDDGHGDAGCRGTILGCPQGREISRAWVARPGGDFEPVGLFCPSDGEVTSVAEAGQQVHGGFERRIPELAVSCAPPRGVVVGIPVHCRSHQSTAFVSWTDSVAGYTVETTARATWEWTFRQRASNGGDEVHWHHTAGEPGSTYPGPGVRQSFTKPGMHQVQVVARWRGWFTVDGLGPFPIHPDLEQRAAVSVPTGSALGVLGQR